MKYAVHLRMPSGGTKVVEIACDEIDFRNSWWARFMEHGEIVDHGPAYGVQTLKPSIVLAAVPAEHVTLIERIA